MVTSLATMLSPTELRTLDAALERIVPFDEDVRAFVLGRAAAQPELYQAGLALLAGWGFADRSPEGQDDVLTEMEGHPSIALIMQHAIEGFYTSPAGFSDVGFRVTA